MPETSDPRTGPRVELSPQRNVQKEMERALRCRAAALEIFVTSRIPTNLQGRFSAEDILQDVWVAAFREAEGLLDLPPDRLDRWLRKVANRVLVSMIRLQTSTRRGGEYRTLQEPAQITTSLVGLFHSVCSSGRTPSSVAAQNELAETVRLAIDRLPELSRKVIWMHHIEGASVEAIAATIERTHDAVRGLLFRAKQQLADELSASDQ